MKVYIKGVFTVLGKDYSDTKDDAGFSVPIDGNKIRVTLKPQSDVIQSQCEIEISTELFNELLAKKQYSSENDMADNLRNEVRKMDMMLIEPIKQALSILKYSFKCKDIDESLCSIKKTMWSKDNIEWDNIPSKINVTMDSYGYLKLDKDNVAIVQDYINKGHYPLLALRHLHRAMNENNPRYKWIDATIAAELAIKEFYVRFNKDLEPLLLELPSPPLSKLYGSILEQYTGKKSPKLKAIREGVEIRNKLVHNPHSENVDDDKANQYLHDIEDAIYHLLYILDPNDFAAKRWGGRVEK